MNFKTHSGFGGDIMVSVFLSYIIIPLSDLYAGPRNRLFFHKFFFHPHGLIQTGRISSVEDHNRNIFLFFTPFFILFQAKKAVRCKRRASCRFTSPAGMLVRLCGRHRTCLPVFLFSTALHVFSALVSTVVLFFPAFFFWHLNCTGPPPEKGGPACLLLIATAVFCISSFILSGIINTAMEISFVLACCLLIRLYLRLFCSGARPGQEVPLRFLFSNESPDASRAFE